MALTDLTRISTSGIATGTSLSGAILHGDAHFRGTQVGVTSALFDSSDDALEFGDNVKLTFGDSGDLLLYHTGNNSIIRDQGAGSLSLQSNGTEIALYNSANSQYMGKFANAAQVELYYAGHPKFQTTSTGAVVTGILTASSFSGPLIGSPINNPSGISTFYDLRVTNNLTVEGTTTTLDTNLIGVDRVEVGANSNTVTGIAVTQSGTADIVRLYDGSTQVVTVDDVGNVGIGSAIPSQKLDVLGTLTYDGTYLDIGGGVTRFTKQGSYNSLEIGYGQNSNQNAFIDLIGDTTYTDYGTRIIRNGQTGANAQTDILHRGTGSLNLQTSDAASIVLKTNGNNQRLSIDSTGHTTIYSGAHDKGLDILPTANSRETRLRIQGKASDGTEHTFTIAGKASSNSLFLSGTGPICFVGSQNVGVQNGIPTSPLHVGDDTNPHTTKALLFVGPASGDGTFHLRGGSPTVFFDSTSGGDPKILTDGRDLKILNGSIDSNGTELLRIDSNGKLCFGTVNTNFASNDGIVSIVNAASSGTENTLLTLWNPTTAVDARAGIDFLTNAQYGTGRDGAFIRASNDGVTAKAHIQFGTIKDETYAEALRITSGGGLQFRNADTPTNNTEPALILNHAGGWQFYASSDSSTHNNIIFGTNSVAAGERLRITSGGDVTTTGTSTFNRQNAGFTARAGDAVSITRASGTPLEINRTGSDGQMISLLDDNTQEAAISISGGSLQFGTPNSSSARLTITSGGKIGINETSPFADFDIASSVEDTDNSTLSQHGIRLHHVGAADEEVIPISAGFLSAQNRARAAIGFISKTISSSAGAGGAIGFYTRNTADGNALYRTDERARVTETGVLLVGHTSSPTSDADKIQAISTSSGTGICLHNYSASSYGNQIAFMKSRSNTIGTNTILQSGDRIGELNFYGNDGSGRSLGAQISVRINGTPGNDNTPAAMYFMNGANQSMSTRLSILPAGTVGISKNGWASNDHSFALTVHTGSTSDSGNPVNDGIMIVSQNSNGNQNSATGKLMFCGHAQTNGPFLYGDNEQAYGKKALVIHTHSTANSYSTQLEETARFKYTGEIRAATSAFDSRWGYTVDVTIDTSSWANNTFYRVVNDNVFDNSNDTYLVWFKWSHGGSGAPWIITGNFLWTPTGANTTGAVSPTFTPVQCAHNSASTISFRGEAGGNVRPGLSAKADTWNPSGGTLSIKASKIGHPYA